MNNLAIKSTDENMRYLVQSRSEPAHWHLVDVLDWNCPCTDFQINVLHYKIKPYCDHMERALIECALDFRKNVLKEQKRFRTEQHEKTAHRIAVHPLPPGRLIGLGCQH